MFAWLKRMQMPPGLLLLTVTLVGLVVALAGTGAYFVVTGGGDSSAGAVCRPCVSLSRLERVIERAVTSAARVNGRLGDEEVARIVGQVSGWRRRCTTLLCDLASSPTSPCRSPSASLLAELAAVDELTDTLRRRTEQCAKGGCQSTRCEQARSVEAAFGRLAGQVGDLGGSDAALLSERRRLSTSFLYDRIDALDETVLSAPGLIAQGRYAAAEVRLLLLRDETSAAEAVVPGSAEAYLADRLDELADSIDNLAEGERLGVSGSALGDLWSELAGASARLLVEAATIETEMVHQSTAFETVLRGEDPSKAAGEVEACEGTVRLIEATQARLAEGLSALAICNQRADCRGDSDDSTSAAPARTEDPRTILKRITEERQLASDALRTMSFLHYGDVDLVTDLPGYQSGEAVTVHPKSQDNICLADSGSRLVVMPAGMSEPTGEVLARGRYVDVADPATWTFDAPAEAGLYKVALIASDRRGAGLFGASEPFTIEPFDEACRGFSGLWTTDFGRLSLVVREGVARGTYRNSDDARAGVLLGNVRGNALTGRWISEIGHGGTRLILSEDGRSFKGTWSHLPERLGGAGTWLGSCASDAPATEGQGAAAENAPPSDDLGRTE